MNSPRGLRELVFLWFGSGGQDHNAFRFLIGLQAGERAAPGPGDFLPEQGIAFLQG